MLSLKAADKLLILKVFIDKLLYVFQPIDTVKQPILPMCHMIIYNIFRNWMSSLNRFDTIFENL